MREIAHDNAKGATRSRRFFECSIANNNFWCGGGRHDDYRLALLMIGGLSRSLSNPTDRIAITHASFSFFAARIPA